MSRIIFAALALAFSFMEMPLHAQADTPTTYRGDLASSDPKVRASALKQLGDLGAAAKGEAPTVAKLIKDPDFNVRFAAMLALPQIVGPEQAAKTFDSIVRDSSVLKGRPIALTGLEKCGTLGLPTVVWALKNGDEPMQAAALATASIVDVEGTLYPDVLPLLLGHPEQVMQSARKYMLAYGLRKFFAEHGRWPVDFIETDGYIRKLNPLIVLAPLTKAVQIRFEPEPEGGLKVRSYAPQPDGSFKTGTFYVIQKPQTK